MATRPLTKRAKEDIHRAFATLGGSGVPEEHLIRMLADHAIGLLELSEETTRGWYVGSGLSIALPSCFGRELYDDKECRDSSGTVCTHKAACGELYKRNHPTVIVTKGGG